MSSFLRINLIIFCKNKDFICKNQTFYKEIADNGNKFPVISNSGYERVT